MAASLGRMTGCVVEAVRTVQLARRDVRFLVKFCQPAGDDAVDDVPQANFRWHRHPVAKVAMALAEHLKIDGEN